MGKRSKRQQSGRAEHIADDSSSVSAGGLKTTSVFDVVLLVLAGIGILLTSYLTYVAWFESHPAF